MSWYVAASLNELLDEINASAPSRNKASDGSIGDADHSSRDSDHNPCDCHNAVCARDFTHDPGGGFDSYTFAEWLRQRCQQGAEQRVKYIISNRKIASPTEGWAWRNYTGSNPHDHHVHVSVDHPQSLFDNATSWAWHGTSTPPPDPGAFDLSKEQYDAIMRKLDSVETKVESVGNGQNKHIDLSATIETKVDSVGTGQNKIAEAENAKLDEILDAVNE